MANKAAATVTVTKARKPEIPAIFALYRAAFPRSERKPFSVIRRMARAGRADLWTIRYNGRFAGLAATVNGQENILLDYFAVRETLRGRGVGSAALQRLMEHYSDRGFFVEIESTFEPSENPEERQKRKEFYVNCGLIPMDTEADVFGVRMELLGVRCHLDFEGYRNFYRDDYSPWAADHIREVQP